MAWLVAIRIVLAIPFQAVGLVVSRGRVMALALSALSLATQARLPPDDLHFEEVAIEALRSGTISALAEDAQGVMWIATLDGLARYDGYRARLYRPDSADPHALGNGQIRALLPDPDGRLWVATEEGIAILDSATDRFTRLQHDPLDPYSLSDNVVLSLAADPRGGVWAGTARGGLNYWDPEHRRFVRLQHAAESAGALPEGPIRSVLVDRQHTLWVGSRNGLVRRPDGAEAFEPIASTGAQGDSMAGQYVFCLFQASDGRIWAGSQNAGAWVIDPQSLQSVHLPAKPHSERGLSHPWLSSIFEASPGQIWLNTFGGGIDVFDAGTLNVVRRIQHDPALPNSLAMNLTSAGLVDRAGLVWVGSWGGGLQRHNPHARAFRVVQHSPLRAQGLSHPSISSLLAFPDGTLWFGTEGNGIDVFDPHRGWQTGHRADAGDRRSLQDGVIRALARTTDGTVWVGTQQAGLHRFLGNGKGFRRIVRAAGTEDERIILLQPRADGQLLVATQRGGAFLDPRDESITPLRLATGEVYGGLMNGFAENPLGTYWLATNDGLYRIYDSGELQRIVAGASVSGRLSHGPVRSVLVDSTGQLVVLTPSGAHRSDGWHDDGQPRFRQLPVPTEHRDALLASAWITDGQGRLWSNYAMFDPDSGRVHWFGRPDGVDIGSLRRNAVTRSADGHLLFGGSKGVLMIDPSRFEPWRYQPPLVVSDLRVGGQRLPFNPAQAIVLRPDRNTLQLEFAALDYSAPTQLRYRYRLDGFDPDWIAADAGGRLASYGKLWPGRYTLRIRGSNRSGAWSPHELSIPVQVLPAFWQTYWFLAILTAALLMLGYWAVRWRTAVINHRAHLLEQQIAQRTAELRAANQHLLTTQQQLVTQEKMAALGTLTAGVAHEINNPTNFSDGAVQTLQSQLQQFHRMLHRLAGDDADPEVLATIDRQFEQFAQMTQTAREGHDRIKAIVRDLRQFTRLDEAEHKRIRIAEPIQSTVNLVRTHFDRIAFELELGINPEIDCQPAKLGQVFMNLIVNACEATLESGRTGRVCISTEQTANEVAIHVLDNGPGMDAATCNRIFEPFFTTKTVGQGTGLGLAVTLGIVREHGGDIAVESTPGQGSRFTVTLPLASHRADHGP